MAISSTKPSRTSPAAISESTGPTAGVAQTGFIPANSILTPAVRAARKATLFGKTCAFISSTCHFVLCKSHSALLRKELDR